MTNVNPIIRHGMQDFVIVKLLTQLNVIEQRLFLYLISKTIEENKPDIEFEITIGELAKMFDVKPQGLYRSFKKDGVDKLSSMQLEFRSDKSVKRYGKVNICEYAYYENKNDSENADSTLVKCKLTRTIENFVFELDNDYVQYKLRYGAKFGKTYSLPIYELLKNKLDRNILASKHGNAKPYFDYNLQEFKDMLEINAPTYENISALERSILKPVLREINDYTDLLVSYEKIKFGKKIDTLRFYVEYKPEVKSIYDEVADKIKENKKAKKQIQKTTNTKPYPKKTTRVEMVPDWLNKENNQEPSELSQEDLNKIEEMKKLQESILNGTV